VVVTVRRKMTSDWTEPYFEFLEQAMWLFGVKRMVEISLQVYHHSPFDDEEE